MVSGSSRCNIGTSIHAGLGHKMNMNKDSLSARKDKFRSEVLMYRGKYPDDMLKDFFEYWTECGGRKMRFEKERTFEVPNV
jgi:hypothetical protein